jgi:hypothetical protein
MEGAPPAPRHIARWDLDKTYLRTDFDTLRELVKTALERPDEKHSHPGAAAVLRELQANGCEVHVLSGSPQQMRRRLEEKLRLDGIHPASLTLKPNLENLLRLRFRSLRGQLGYKLPALLRMRVHVEPELRETLVGDDAEADAFIYSLYAELCAGKVEEERLERVMRIDRCHPEEIQEALASARAIDHAPGVPGVPGVPGAAGDGIVDRILIHLDRQTPPSEFDVYGARLVPFYNYFQAALVLHEDGRLSADAVLRVGTDLVLQHRFDGDALTRSYMELARRGHLRGDGIDDLGAALERWPVGEGKRSLFGLDEVQALGRRARELREASAIGLSRRTSREGAPDWEQLVSGHNRRRK